MIEIIEKKSRFLAYSFLIRDEDDIKFFLDKLKKEHKKATHICYAYNLFGKTKSSDDGEPGGTAGLPMLNVILKNNLNNVLVVVVRYFGGIKLGANGLVRVYSECAKQVLISEPINNLQLYKECCFYIGFDKQKNLELISRMKYIKNIHYEYNENIFVKIDILNKDFDQLIDFICKNLNLSLNDINVKDFFN